LTDQFDTNWRATRGNVANNDVIREIGNLPMDNYSARGSSTQRALVTPRRTALEIV